MNLNFLQNAVDNLLNGGLTRLVILLMSVLFVLSCQTKPEETEQKKSEAKKEEKESDNSSNSKEINKQLRLESGFTLVDNEKGITLFDFPPYVGEVRIEYPNDSTLILIGKTNLPNKTDKYEEYSPVMLTVHYSKSDYKAFRDTEKETFPKMDKDDFEKIIKKFDILKSDTIVTKFEPIEEDENQSDEEFKRIKNRLAEKENKIVGYDTDLTIAILNGCKECKDIFMKDWPKILGDNLNGSIAEQHSWNEKLIKEFERQIEN